MAVFAITNGEGGASCSGYGGGAGYGGGTARRDGGGSAAVVAVAAARSALGRVTLEIASISSALLTHPHC